MDRNQSGQGSGGSMGGGGFGGGDRPEVLDTISETQLNELDRQYDEGDREYWYDLTNSYGWTRSQADEVWNYFGQRPRGGTAGTGGPGSPSVGGGSQHAQGAQGGGETF